MRRSKSTRLWRLFPLLASTLLGGCNLTLLNPMGQIGLDERSIIYLATGLMLIVVIPVIIMTLVFAWRYRATNTSATYAPDWAHSGKIEAVVWLIPCLIIAALATVTWVSSHKLDPYRPIPAAAKPITIDVVSLDWKWLFIYPDLHIATVNQIAFPVNTPVAFRITSGSVMNSFFIPRLGSQVYSMAGMQTQLHLIANKEGSYRGISANYSGDGFSGMNFKALSVSKTDFETWVAKAKSAGATLDAATFRKLMAPSEDVPVTYYGSVDPNLFHDILHKCFFAGSGSACRTTAEAKE